MDDHRRIVVPPGDAEGHGGRGVRLTDQLGDDELTHDLRQELSVVTHLVERLRRLSRRCPEMTSTVSALHGQIGVLWRLIGSVRDGARAWRPVDVAGTVEEVAAAAAASHDGDVRVRSEQVPPVVAPAALLRRALLNVVVNACEAAPGEDVDVAVTAEPGAVVVEVVDHGATTRDPAEDTSGLGSWVVHSVVHDCGGTVERQRRPEGGRRVVLRLPAARRGLP